MSSSNIGAVGRLVLVIIAVTMVLAVVAMALEERRLGRAVVGGGLLVLALVSLGLAVIERRRRSFRLVVGVLVAMAGAGGLLQGLHGKRSSEGELGIQLMIWSAVGALVFFAFVLPLWWQLRKGGAMGRARRAVAALGWTWSWRSDAQTGLVDGQPVTVEAAGVSAGLPVALSFGPGLERPDLAALALLGPASRGALSSLASRPGVDSMYAVRGTMALAVKPELDAEGLAELVRALAEARRVVCSEIDPAGQVGESPQAGADRAGPREAGLTELAERAAQRVRVDPDPSWRLTTLEALLALDAARSIARGLVEEITEEDPHPRVALRAAEARGDDAAVGRIRARLGTAGGGLAVATSLSPDSGGGLSLPTSPSTDGAATRPAP